MMELGGYITAFLFPLLIAAKVTVQVSLGAFIFAIATGLILATLRYLLPIALIRVPIAVFVEIFRNVPSLTHLFIIYFGLAYAGIRFGSISSAIIALGLIGGAMLTDVFRAGFEAVHTGQREAALAVGMTPRLAFREIILPQTWRVTLPPIGNYAVQLVKDTSLVAAIAAPEVMFTARNLVVTTFETSIIYAFAAGVYLLLCLPLSRLAKTLEQRMAIPR
jgi:His/Glu/Gln/Arg/opine family amino acid ABC transporter permease subunit